MNRSQAAPAAWLVKQLFGQRSSLITLQLEIHMIRICRKAFRISAILVAVLASAASNAAVTTKTITAGDKYFVNGNEECVLHTRRFVKSLPFGLYTLAQKKKIINSSTVGVGRAAIMDLGAVGHTGVVTALDNSGSSRSITIAEHNVPLGAKAPRYRTATCGSKITDCEKQLGILGYYKP